MYYNTMILWMPKRRVLCCWARFSKSVCCMHSTLICTNCLDNMWHAKMQAALLLSQACKECMHNGSWQSWLVKLAGCCPISGLDRTSLRQTLFGMPCWCWSDMKDTYACRFFVAYLTNKEKFITVTMTVLSWLWACSCICSFVHSMVLISSDSVSLQHCLETWADIGEKPAGPLGQKQWQNIAVHSSSSFRNLRNTDWIDCDLTVSVTVNTVIVLFSFNRLLWRIPSMFKTYTYT